MNSRYHYKYSYNILSISNFLIKFLGQYFYDTKEHFYVKKNRFFENLESKSPLKDFQQKTLWHLVLRQKTFLEKTINQSDSTDPEYSVPLVYFHPEKFIPNWRLRYERDWVGLLYVRNVLGIFPLGSPQLRLCDLTDAQLWMSGVFSFLLLFPRKVSLDLSSCWNCRAESKGMRSVLLLMSVVVVVVCWKET